MSNFQFGIPICMAGSLVVAAGLCVAPAHAAVTISTAATQNMSCTSGVCTPTAANAVLSVSDLTAMLASGNVQVNTGSGSLAQQVEDIVIAAGFNWTSAGSLTLDAYRSVTVTQPIAENGTGAVSLITNDGGSAGTLSFISGGSLSFVGTANSLSIDGKTYTLVSSVKSLAAAIAHKSSGYYALSASYDANADGTYKVSPIPSRFKGTFNGLGNAISNLAIDGEGKKGAGLFGYVDSKGKINSIVLANINITVQAGQDSRQVVAGALAAFNYGFVFNSFATGQINETASRSVVYAGGLLGGNAGTVLDSAASTTLRTLNGRVPGAAFTGGLVADNAGTIESSYATGATSDSTAAYAGGLAGENSGVIRNCYAGGSEASASNSETGGLVGLTYSSSVSASYSTGAPSGGSGSSVGGFLGYDDSGGGSSDNFWDTTTSGITNLAQGAGNITNDPGIAGETTAQLQAALPSGFDPTIWAENPGINNGLPYLIANPPR